MRTRRGIGGGRRGIATLELVMATPLLLVMGLAIAWLGRGVITLAEVTVEARDDAWRRRREANPRPFRFGGADGQVAGSVERKVEGPPLLREMGPARSSHTVLGGSWDHRQVDLDHPPHWRLYGELADEAGRDAIARARAEVGGMGAGLASAQQVFDAGRGVAMDWLSKLGFIERDANAAVAEKIGEVKKQVDAKADEIRRERDRLVALKAMLDRKLEALDRKRDDKTLAEKERRDVEKEREQNRKDYRKASDDLDLVEKQLAYGKAIQDSLKPGPKAP